MKRDSKISKGRSRSILEDTFEKIYLQNFDRLFLFATTITKSREMAKDVVSDVFMALWEKRTQLSRIKEIESYLFVSVKNHAIRLVSKRSHSLRDENMEGTLLAIDRINPEEILLGKELFDFIEKTVSELPDKARLVFRMAKDKQLSYKDIALELDVSVSTVKSQLVRATAIVKTAILEKIAEEDDHSGLFNYGIPGIVLICSLFV